MTTDPTIQSLYNAHIHMVKYMIVGQHVLRVVCICLFLLSMWVLGLTVLFILEWSKRRRTDKNLQLMNNMAFPLYKRDEEGLKVVPRGTFVNHNDNGDDY